MLRTLWNIFPPGDVLLADRLMCTWTEMVMLKQRGIDTVCRLTSHRTADFRRGTRIGKYDHIVEWKKPTKPRTVDREVYNALPESLFVRECRVLVVQPGFRTRSLIVVTTLLDTTEYTKEDLAQLYRARWNVEVSQSYYPLCHSLYQPRSRTPPDWNRANRVRVIKSVSVSSTRADTAGRTSFAHSPSTASVDRVPGRRPRESSGHTLRAACAP
jgi:hypothetical protein